MSDQHNANVMGCSGHQDVRTPCLDALADQGALFTKGYCNNPICAPSRASFHSGLYVKNHGLSGNTVRQLSDNPPPLLGATFRSAGYETGMVGKAHIPGRWVREAFEHYRFSDLADAEADDPRTCHYFNDLVENKLGDQYEHGKLLPGHPGHGNRAFISGLPEEFSLEAWIGRKAVEFLSTRDRKRPFFLNVSFQRPHDPFAPPATKAGEYAPERLRLPENADDFLEKSFFGKPAFMQRLAEMSRGSGYPFRPKDASELKSQLAAYLTLVSMIDSEIGNIISELRRIGDLDNTIICYVSDHGDFAGEHGLILKNLGIYESIHRIPWIMAGPGIPSGLVCEELVESVDLFPTLCSLAGVAAPTGLDGKPLFDAGQFLSPARSAVFCEWDFVNEPQTRVLAVRTLSHRLVYYLDAVEDGELYDIVRDPGEVNNLFADPQCRPIRDELIQHAIEWRGIQPRTFGQSEEKAVLAQVDSGATGMIHRLGKRWSEVQHLVKGTPGG